MRGQNDHTLHTSARVSDTPGHIHQVHEVTKKKTHEFSGTCSELVDGCKHTAIISKEVTSEEQKLNQRQKIRVYPIYQVLDVENMWGLIIC